MVQESIVEYINSQMKLGVSRDAIKTTLTGAGWQVADVEDTLKKVEAAKVAQPMSAMPMGSASASPSMAAAAKPADPSVTSRVVTPMGGPATGGPGPQTFKVSDLVSSPASAGKPAATASATGPTSKSPMTGPAAMNSTTAAPAGIKSGNTFQAASYPGMKPRGSRGALITEIVLVIIILAVGGFAGFLFMQNSSLNAQLGSLNGQSSGVNSQLSALQAQVAASTTALTAEVSSLTGENQELQTELSFYAAPSSTTPGATSTATIGGTIVGGGKTPYVITATDGAKVYVANSKDATVIAALGPLMATTSTAAATGEFSGTYIPGSDSITLTEVNGTAVQ